MFTGIITDLAEVREVSRTESGLTLAFKRPAEWDDISLGESIATNGVCLTVSAIGPDEYECYLMAETLAKTSFGISVPGTVNLERSLRADSRLGGHFVQGHVDSRGTVTSIENTDDSRIIIKPERFDRRLVVYKGSIAIDGVSLTVSAVIDDGFEVSLIPHTLQHSTLGNLKVGDAVNIEFDILGKYIANLAKDVLNAKGPASSN